MTVIVIRHQQHEIDVPEINQKMQREVNISDSILIFALVLNNYPTTIYCNHI